MKSIVRATGICAAALVMHGCASMFSHGNSEFACPGMDGDGVRCLSAKEVYEATDHQSGGVAPEEVSRIMAAREGQSINANERIEHFYARSDVAPLPTQTQPQPVRTAPKIMRIWFGPWEDQSGDLHFPSIAFTEIEPRRWNYGTKAPEPSARLRSNLPTQTRSGASRSSSSEASSNSD